jgi:acyl-[acyl carrier protein]--UDP-N-acetylglucosamine O-acyltransferase
MMYLNANTGIHINGGGAQIQANSAIITLYGGNGINLIGNTKLNNNLEVVGTTTIGGYTRINDSAYIDGTLQVTDRVYSNITSSGTSVFSRADINSSLYANGSIGITNTFTVLVAGGSRSFQFSYGILIGSSFIP